MSKLIINRAWLVPLLLGAFVVVAAGCSAADPVANQEPESKKIAIFDGGEVTLGEKLAVFAAQLTGFGVVWVARYIILDRWLFKVTHHGQEPGEDDLEMMHGDLPI